MLNYIWAGLIVFSLAFALISDVNDLARSTYRNDAPLPVTIAFPEGYRSEARRQPVTVAVAPDTYRTFYGVEAPAVLQFEGTLVQVREGRQLQFARDADLGEPLATIRSATSARDNDLRGPVTFEAAPSDTTAAAQVRFAPVRFVKLAAITQAAIDFAETAVTIALGLIGVIALWMGLLRIAEDAGMIRLLVRITQPLVRRLFPEIPAGHPAIGLIVLNLSANVLGLGNAATPMGIKAMESLQTLNRTDDTATNSMVMLLAMNTASVQIIPPTLLVAIMGLQVNQLFFSILITTAISLVIGILAARLLGRLKPYRLSDPARLPDNDTPPA